MTIFSIISLLGGLAMFLYGMEIMGDGLKNASGPALKNVLSTATKNVTFGVITGMLVTGVIQSSTATIVLTVGLISAGILSLKQAVGIVMGANIGTTITAQMIRLMDIDSSGNMVMQFFKPATLAPLAMFIGILLIVFIKRPNSKTKGEIFMGFGILFSGIINMTAAVSPLADSPAFADIMARFSDQPILAILVGLVLTVLVQSSSAMVGILQALSATGAVTFELVYPMIMGINLGTCFVTLFICSIGSTKDAKRIGIVHILFNTIGTIGFMIVMTIIRSMGAFPSLWDSVVDSGGIADFQTLFNLVTAIALIPFASKLVEASYKLIKPSVTDEEPNDLRVPDEHLFEVPQVALAEATKGIAHMGEVALKNLKRSYGLLEAFDDDIISRVNEVEDELDQYTDSMENFLLDLAKHVETDADSMRITTLMQASTNFERIGDHAVNIMEVAQNVNTGNLEFSSSAREEIKLVKDASFEITQIVIDAFARMDSEAAKLVEPLEEVIDEMVIALKNRHIERLKLGKCTIANGMAFVEALNDFERIADQCSNIALLILSESDKKIKGNHHAYIRELHKGGDELYNVELAKRKEQYLQKLVFVD